MAVVVRPYITVRPSHPYYARTKHVGFPSTRQASRALSANRCEAFGESYGGRILPVPRSMEAGVIKAGGEGKKQQRSSSIRDHVGWTNGTVARSPLGVFFFSRLGVYSCAWPPKCFFLRLKAFVCRFNFAV